MLFTLINSLDFNEDDPLADLLSEDDTSKETSIPIMTSQTKKITDLFGIKTNGVSTEKSNVSQPKINSVSRNVNETKSNTLPKENSFRIDSNDSTTNNLPKENSFKVTSNSTVNRVPEKSLPKRPHKSLFDDSDDIVSNLTEKTRSLNSEQAKKSSLMENLFGGLTNKSTSDSRKINEIPSTQSKIETKSNHPSSSFNSMTKSESILSVPSTITNTGYSPTTVVSASRESRRGRRPSTGLLDPLGLLGNDQKSDVNLLSLIYSQLINL